MHYERSKSRLVKFSNVKSLASLSVSKLSINFSQVSERFVRGDNMDR